MATASKVQGILERIPDSGVWWIRFTDSDGKRHLEKAGRRGDAIDLLSKRKHDILLRRKLPEKLRGKTLTFGELAQDALRHSQEANGDRSTHELALKVAIINADFEQRPVEGITKQDIQNWLMEQTEEREWSPATRNRYQAAFSLVFRVAVDNEKLTVNPASRIKRKAENNDRIRFLSNDEETLLTATVSENWPQYLPAFLVSLHSGMRASEQFTLQWDQVSLERKSISLYKTKGKKTRYIPLNSIALEAFKSLKQGRKASGPVFLNTDGSPLRGSRDWFEPAVKKAGLEQYTWHCNRHTFASRLVMLGVDIRTVAQLMGHSTIQMTMRYAHLAPEHAQTAVDRLVPSAAVVTKSATGNSRKVVNAVSR
jgi:site-specific recombinase XerD